MSRPLSLALLVLIASVACFVSCSDDETSATVTLSSLWPNSDGSSWSFDGRSLELDPLHVIDDAFFFEDPDSLPPPPEWDAILDLIANPIYPAGMDTVLGTFGLVFRDSMDYPPGRAQYLAQVVNGDEDSTECIVLAAALDRGRMSIGWERRRFLERMLRPSVVTSGPVAPLFLNGGAFVKTEEFIGGYHCVSDTLSWLYVTSDLDPGSTFSIRPIPELAPEVVLYGRVGAPASVSTPAGVFSGAIEVDYFVDFGAVDFGAAGYLRAIDYGRVYYAPGVGPITGWERNFVPVGQDTLGAGFTETEVRLTDYSPAP